MLDIADAPYSGARSPAYPSTTMVAPQHATEAVYTVPGVVLLRVHGPLHFATIGSFKALVDRTVELACTCQPHGIHTIVRNVGKSGISGILSMQNSSQPRAGSSGIPVLSPVTPAIDSKERSLSPLVRPARPACDCAHCAEGWEGAWLPARVPLQALVIDLGLVPSLDISAVMGLQEVAELWLSKGAAVVLVVPQGDAASDHDQTRMYLHEYRRRQRLSKAQREREEKRKSRDADSMGLGDLELGPTAEKERESGDELASKQLSPSSNVISRLPSAFLPALMPVRWQNAAATIAALMRASPTKPLPALALGGVVEGLGDDALFHSVEEALVALHHRGVIPLPPTAM